MKRYRDLELIIHPNKAFWELHKDTQSREAILRAFETLPKRDLWKYADVAFKEMK